jgi:hypothetical protein
MKKGSSYLTSRRFCVDLTAQNLDKKDLFSESDPFYLVYRTNEDGEDTLVYRSEWIKVHMASPLPGVPHQRGRGGHPRLQIRVD